MGAELGQDLGLVLLGIVFGIALVAFPRQPKPRRSSQAPAPRLERVATPAVLLATDEEIGVVRFDFAGPWMPEARECRDPHRRP